MHIAPLLEKMDWLTDAERRTFQEGFEEHSLSKEEAEALAGHIGRLMGELQSMKNDIDSALALVEAEMR